MKHSFILLLLLFIAGVSHHAAAQRVPKHQLWMEEGWASLGGSYGQTEKAKAITWFRRVKWCYFFSKKIRNRAMLGISDYQLYRGDTAHAVKTLKKVVGKRICHKVETGNAGKIRERRKEEWNRYYAACGIAEIYLAQKAFEQARLFTGYADTTVYVTWTCGLGSLIHDSWVEHNMLRYWIGVGSPEDAYAYWYGRFGLEDMLRYPENSQLMDSLVKYNLVAPSSAGFSYNQNKEDSLICKSLFRKYTKQTLRDSFDNFGHDIHRMDTIMDSGLKVRIYYGNFLGKQIRLTAWFSDEKRTPITPEQDQNCQKVAELLVYHSWIYRELEK